MWDYLVELTSPIILEQYEQYLFDVFWANYSFTLQDIYLIVN